MNVLVHGSKKFSDYAVFMRAMGIALTDIKDSEFNVYSLGPVKVNNFTAEFCNMSEDSLKARGIKVRHFKVPYSFATNNMREMDAFFWMTTPDDKTIPTFVSIADRLDIPNYILRF